MFGLLGVKPIRGRFYNAAEDADNVAVISESYWRTTLGAIPTSSGRRSRSMTCRTPSSASRPPDSPAPSFGASTSGRRSKSSQRKSMNMQIVARLKPGATSDTSARELTQFRSEVEAGLPRWAGCLRGAQYLAAPIAYDATARSVVRVGDGVVARGHFGAHPLRELRERGQPAARPAGSPTSRAGGPRRAWLRPCACDASSCARGTLARELARQCSRSSSSSHQPVVQGALFPDGSWIFSLSTSECSAPSRRSRSHGRAGVRRAGDSGRTSRRE